MRISKNNCIREKQPRVFVVFGSEVNKNTSITSKQKLVSNEMLRSNIHAIFSELKNSIFHKDFPYERLTNAEMGFILNLIIGDLP